VGTLAAAPSNRLSLRRTAGEVPEDPRSDENRSSDEKLLRIHGEGGLSFLLTFQTSANLEMSEDEIFAVRLQETSPLHPSRWEGA
jgi:hypothetical protein